nr:MAG TPA: hypothetical protein [Caudoviricetes sp.]
MNEVTVKELVTALEDVLVNVESVEGYGISVNMTKVRLTYDEDFDKITFKSGNYNYEYVVPVSFNVADCIEVITLE